MLYGVARVLRSVLGLTGRYRWAAWLGLALAGWYLASSFSRASAADGQPESVGHPLALWVVNFGGALAFGAVVFTLGVGVVICADLGIDGFHHLRRYLGRTLLHGTEPRLAGLANGDAGRNGGQRSGFARGAGRFLGRWS